MQIEDVKSGGLEKLTDRMRELLALNLVTLRSRQRTMQEWTRTRPSITLLAPQVVSSAVSLQAKKQAMQVGGLAQASPAPEAVTTNLSTSKNGSKITNL